MEQQAVAARGDAPPGRGDARPARHRRPARPGAALAVRRPAAAGGHRLGAHRAPAGCWCSTSRPRRSTRPRPRRCWPRSPGWCTTSARPSSSPSTGWSGCCSTPTAMLLVDGGRVGRRHAGRGRWRPARSRRRWSSWAGWPAGRRCRCRCATPAAWPGRCASGSATAAPRRPSVPARRADDAAPCCWPRGVSVRYGDTVAVREVDLRLRAGEVVALMGRNGSGKSSLLWALQGSGRRQAGRGRRRAAGRRAGSAPREARGLVGLVPQTASDLLYLETVDRRVPAGRPRGRGRARARAGRCCCG